MKLGNTVLIRSTVEAYCMDRECLDVIVQCEDGGTMLFDVPREQVIEESQFNAISVLDKARETLDPSKYIESYVRNYMELLDVYKGREYDSN